MADKSEEEYSEEEYEEDDFEEEEDDEELEGSEGKEVHDNAIKVVSNSVKRSATPHGKKEEKIEDQSGDGVGAVDGLDLERYMKTLKDPMDGDDAEELAEDLAAELKPLDGMKPTAGSAEQAELRSRLGYSETSSPMSVSHQSGINIIMNSPGVARNTVLGVMELVGLSDGKKPISSKESPTEPGDENSASSHGTPSKLSDDQEHPSTRTSKSSVKSPCNNSASNSKKSTKSKKENEFMSEIDRYLINMHNEATSPVKQQEQSSDEHKVSFASQASVVAAAVAESSKKFLNTENGGVAGSRDTPIMDSVRQEEKDLGIGFSSEQHLEKQIKKSKERSAETDRENAERVDALLMELFPERYEGKNKKVHLGGNPKKPPQGKGKKHPVGYKKDQHYGLGARVDGAAEDEMIRSSSQSVVSKHQYPHRSISPVQEYNSENDESGGALNSLDLQIKRLKKDIRNKDDKIKRITDHAIMMANHMDKLKGEAAVLRSNLEKAHMVIEAKDARIDELSKRKKKVVVRRVRVAAEGNDPDIAALQSDNQRLREREQALVEALEDMSAQNEDLIMKLKDSMERELELSSKRAAQINHQLPHIIGKSGSVSAGSDSKEGGGRRQRDGDHRARSEPIDEHVVPKRRQKKL